MINHHPKPVYMAFQTFALLVTLFNLAIEYCNWNYPCCDKNTIDNQGMYILLLMCDALIVPFYAVLGIQYGNQCLEYVLMFEMFRPVVLGYMPWIVFGFVAGLFIILGIGAGRECKNLVKFVIIITIASGLFCMFSMIVSSPKYVGIPVVIKMVMEGVLAFCDDS